MTESIFDVLCDLSKEYAYFSSSHYHFIYLLPNFALFCTGHVNKITYSRHDTTRHDTTHPRYPTPFWAPHQKAFCLWFGQVSKIRFYGAFCHSCLNSLSLDKLQKNRQRIWIQFSLLHIILLYLFSLPFIRHSTIQVITLQFSILDFYFNSCVSCEIRLRFGGCLFLLILFGGRIENVMFWIYDLSLNRYVSREFRHC